MFRRPTARYGDTPAAETPHQLARQIWDDRIGSARVQARNWRLAFFGQLLLSAGFATGLIILAERGTIVPWVVQVDKLGNAQAIGPATAHYSPTDPVIARNLADVIEWLRSVSADPVDMRNHWLKAYGFLTAKEKAALNDYAQHNDPFAKVGKEEVSVEVTSVIRATDESFRVEWIEQHYTAGTLAATEHWSAIVTIVIQPPRDETKLNFNPLGIYIDAINWSKELG